MAMQNSPARSGIDVGSVIADTYTIEALIGRGGMGAVFLASHKRLPGKQVAIKVLHAEMSGEEVLARFRREAEIASRLGHPNIVQVHDFNLMPDGTPYLVLEYLRGESLAQRLHNGPLPLDQMTSIVRQIGSALAAAHREGIVHRDLKPQNIFLVPTEVDGRVVEIAKVLDFGISKIRGSTTVKTQDSSLLGTPQYMAPEQATGQHKLVDERTDVFALGAIVYEMLMGHPAFTGETIPEVVFKVVYEQPSPLTNQSEAITTAVHRAMAKAQADRYANVGEFVEALTGAPLLPVGRPGKSIPPPELGFAVGSRAPNTDRAPNTGKDAFAQTMGSGDHGAAATQLPPSQAPIAQPSAGGPVVGTAQPGVGTAPTMHSQNQALVNAGTVSAPPPPGVSRRKGPLIAVIVLGVAAIAAVGIVVATRSQPTPPPKIAEVAPSPPPPVQAEKPPVEATKPPVEATKPPVEAEKPPVEAVKPPVDAKKPPVDAKKPPAQDTKQKPPAADDETADDGDEAVAKQLHEAEAALAASKWDRAESLANTVSSSEDSNVRQKQRAALIFGTVQCLARNDEGRARIALRKLVGAPKLRRKLIDACHTNNYLQNVR